MKIETWYVMEDGSCGDPRDVAEGADGVLRHTDGRAVAYRPDGVTPRARGVDVDAEQAKVEAGAKVKEETGSKGKGKSKDVKPDENQPGYKTRETKAD